MKRIIALTLIALVSLAFGCGKSGSSGTTTSSSKPKTTSKASAKSSASSAKSGAKGKGDGSGQGKGEGTKKGRELKEMTKGVMDALKKGDFEAAAKFAQKKDRKEYEKAFKKMVEKKKWRADAIKGWSGKAGKEVRVDGDKARVEIGSKGDEIWVLQFKKKDKKWYVDDLKSPSKKDHKKWGKEI